MKKPRKPEQFIKTPGYPGGKEALSSFIRKNMKYPVEAFKNKVEGTVIVAFDYNENGKVIQTRIKKGLGSGCDEEAQRLVKMLMFRKVKQKGVRVIYHSTVNIRFRLNTVQANAGMKYQYTSTSNSNKSVEEKKSGSYSYTVTIKRS